VTVTVWPLALPLAEGSGVSDSRPEAVIEGNGDLLVDTETVWPLAEKAADELCDLTVLFETEADTVTDFDIGPVADWLIEPELLFDWTPVLLEVVEPVPDLDVDTEPLDVRVITPEGEWELDTLGEPVELDDGDDEAAADAE